MLCAVYVHCGKGERYTMLYSAIQLCIDCIALVAIQCYTMSYTTLYTDADALYSAEVQDCMQRGLGLANHARITCLGIYKYDMPIMHLRRGLVDAHVAHQSMHVLAHACITKDTCKVHSSIPVHIYQEQ